MALSSASMAQDSLPEIDPSIKAAFTLDYDTVVEKGAAGLETGMQATIQCAGDLMLHSMIDDDQISSSVYMSIAEVYMVRGKLLAKSGETMPKSAKKWMKSKKWSRGKPGSFDAYGEPRFDVLDEAGNKAFIENADNCRQGVVGVLNESEMGAIALEATFRTIS